MKLIGKIWVVFLIALFSISLSAAGYCAHNVPEEKVAAHECDCDIAEV